MMKAKPNCGVGALSCNKPENETHPSNSSQASEIDDRKVQCVFEVERTLNEKENNAGIDLTIHFLWWKV